MSENREYVEQLILDDQLISVPDMTKHVVYRTMSSPHTDQNTMEF